jgi:hypothetical protein
MLRAGERECKHCGAVFTLDHAAPAILLADVPEAGREVAAERGAGRLGRLRETPTSPTPRVHAAHNALSADESRPAP